jgi:selenocysteine lyase/cysteine desulfurase
MDQMRMTKTSSFGHCLELGTLNYEACEGVRGIGRYLMDLHCEYRSSDEEDRVENLVEESVKNAFELIERAEGPLVRLLLKGLQSSSKVRILGTVAESPTRIPVVSFVHCSIPSSRIVAACSNGGVICRNGTFLSSERFQEKHAIDGAEGVVRFSLVHYNTVAEVKYAISLLESIPNWF